jgi:hypothetical protein
LAPGTYFFQANKKYDGGELDKKRHYSDYTGADDYGAV